MWAEPVGEDEGPRVGEDERDADGSVADRSSGDRATVSQQRRSGVCRRPLLPRQRTRHQARRHQVVARRSIAICVCVCLSVCLSVLSLQSRRIVDEEFADDLQYTSSSHSPLSSTASVIRGVRTAKQRAGKKHRGFKKGF